MGLLNLSKLKAVAPTPQPESVILPNDKSTDLIVTNEVLRTNAEEVLTQQSIGILEAENITLPADLESEADIIAREERKLSELISDDFPFDESQLAAVYGMANEAHACLTGAAGTGKTTVTKKLVSLIQTEAGEVDMSTYFKKEVKSGDPDDDYEIPEKFIPSICLVGFTGRSTQMIKKNFPRDWHGNIMTIHRMLAYAPEYFPEFDDATGEIKNKMRFTPSYDINNKLPWDVILIDEAGMVGLDLWHEIYAAMKEGCRVYMIGDINQLPPVHGRSIFGFALGKWPAWELTHIHRQEGKNNSIVDNAWRIINGEMPISDLADKNHNLSSKESLVACMNAMIKEDWQFAMVKLPEEVPIASARIRMLLQVMNGRFYDPLRDSVITAINGHEESSHGYQLGQLPLNRELAILFNKENPRYIIEASRGDRKFFAVGDKVMATRNDHEAGITNGMTGTIVSIERHGGYAGDHMRFGLVSEVSAYLLDIAEPDDDSDFTLEELADTHSAQEDSKTKEKDRGPSSHIVTVKFGEGEHSFEIAFSSLAEVGSLMVAYVVTCHKMQGGESPLVVVICHQAHRKMLFREWAYTGVTRGSRRVLFLYTDLGIRTALMKQRIKGKTMAEKVQSFQEMQKIQTVGGQQFVGVSVRLMDARALTTSGHESPTPPATQLLKPIDKSNEPSSNPAESVSTHTHTHTTHERIIERVVIVERERPAPVAPVDGGMIHPEKPKGLAAMLLNKPAPKIEQWHPIQEPMVILKPQWGAYQRLRQIEDSQTVPLLTYQPAPEPVPHVPVIKTYKGLAALLNKGK